MPEKGTKFKNTGREIMKVSKDSYFDITPRYKRLLDDNNGVQVEALKRAGCPFPTIHKQWRTDKIELVGMAKPRVRGRNDPHPFPEALPRRGAAPAPVTTMVDEEPATHIDLDEEVAPEAPEKPKKPAKKTRKKRTAKKKKKTTKK